MQLSPHAFPALHTLQHVLTGGGAGCATAAGVRVGVKTVIVAVGVTVETPIAGTKARFPWKSTTWLDTHPICPLSVICHHAPSVLTPVTSALAPGLRLANRSNSVLGPLRTLTALPSVGTAIYGDDGVGSAVLVGGEILVGGTAVGTGMTIGCGVSVAVDIGVSVGCAVSVGCGVFVGIGVPLGNGVLLGAGVGESTSSGVRVALIRVRVAIAVEVFGTFAIAIAVAVAPLFSTFVVNALRDPQHKTTTATRDVMATRIVRRPEPLCFFAGRGVPLLPTVPHTTHGSVLKKALGRGYPHRGQMSAGLVSTSVISSPVENLDFYVQCLM